MINDKVVATKSGVNFTDKSSVSVYDVEVSPDGHYKLDKHGVAQVVRHLGAVKSGTRGVVVGNPVPVYRRCLVEDENSTPVGGVDFIMMYPIMWDYYGKRAWVSQDHFNILGSSVEVS